ncbi:MAG: hypothetical protein ACRCT7_17670 [Shewanella sp.]
MAKFKDKLKYLLVFLVSFSLGMTFVAVADRFIAKRMIERDATVLADKFHLYLSKLAGKLLELPSLTTPNGCTADIEKLLKQTTFDANFIRWVAITKDNRVVCQIDETNHNIETISSHKIKESISIGVAAEITNSHHEIFLIRHMDGYDYMACITPLRPYYFVPLDCRRCLEYRVSLDSEPYFEFG